MDYRLTDEQELLRRTVREFAVRELEPMAQEMDDREEFPWEHYRKLGEMDLTGLGIRPEYGGVGGGMVETAIAVEELSRSDPSVGLVLLVSLSLCTMGISLFANESQKAKYLPPLTRGEVVGAFGYTEPNAGSDAVSIVTQAARVEGGYLLNGSKVFITNGDVAQTVLVFATEDRVQRSRGVVGFIVEKGTPRFTARQQKGKLGMRASSTAELFFKDCFVPEENRVTEPGMGFRTAMQIMDHSRPIVGAQAVGIAQGALDLALKYVQQREQFGQTLSQFQGVQWMLADMATQVEAARLLVYRAASLLDQGLPAIKEASMAKLFASETAMRVATTALQLHGGYGYFKENPVERFFRDAKVTEIYEGTSQIQRLVIARQLLAESGT